MQGLLLETHPVGGAQGILHGGITGQVRPS